MSASQPQNHPQSRETGTVKLYIFPSVLTNEFLFCFWFVFLALINPIIFPPTSVNNTSHTEPGVAHCLCAIIIYECQSHSSGCLTNKYKGVCCHGHLGIRLQTMSQCLRSSFNTRMHLHTRVCRCIFMLESNMAPISKQFLNEQQCEVVYEISKRKL